MAGNYPSLNDSNFDLLKKITSNTAEIANEADIPPQPGNSGKLLTTNGTNTAWTTNGTLTSLTSPASSALTLGTTDSGAAITVLSASNNVGVGNVTPVQKLDVAGVTGGPSASGTSADGALRLLAGSYNMVLDMGVNHAVSTWIQSRDKTNYVTNYDLALQPNGGNIGIGTTNLTGLTGSGGLKIASSTAGSANAGALVLQGGISAGNTGSAASYFGGAVTAAGDITSAGLFRVTDGQAIRNTQTGGSGAFYLDSASVAFRNPNTGYSTLMSIGAGGLAVTPAATFSGAVTAQRLEAVDAAASTGPAAFFRTQNNTTYGSSVLSIQGDRTTTDSSYNLISAINGDSSGVFRVRDSGNVVNTNNSYGAVSDQKLKENIVDATAKLGKLNQVRIVNFNRIGNGQKQIGVIAQELEQIFPSMIEVAIDRDAEGNDLGTTTKSVKYSVFVPMLIKAVQELTARLAALEAK